jgi:hypothetical protein
MIPLWIFLLIWLVLMSMYVIMAFLSVMQLMRYGVASFGTYVSSFGFLAITSIVILGTGIYFLTVDWSQGLDLFSGLSSSGVFQTPELP